MGAVAMYALVAWLACWYAVTAAIPPQPPVQPPASLRRSVQVPSGKAHVYKYEAVVSAGQNEPTPFASKLRLQGKLINKHYADDPDLKFVEYFKFQDIKHSVYNGPKDDDASAQFQAIADELKDFEKPVLVVLDENNKLQGIKVQEEEAEWSKNLKKSVASIIQVEATQFELQENMKPATFETIEKTIHGNCQVEYNVYPEKKDGKTVFFIRKSYEPRKCSKYVQSLGNSNPKSSSCEVKKEEDLVTFATRVYEIEPINEGLLVRKITTHEKLSYLPFQHRGSGIQYIETSQTFEFEKMVDESELTLPTVDFKGVEVMSDITFDKSIYVSQEYEGDGILFGRQVLSSKYLKKTVQKLLLSVTDYLLDNHIDSKEGHPEYKKSLEKLHRYMKYLDYQDLLYLLAHFNENNKRGALSRKIFLELVPHIGTSEVWDFARNIIENFIISKDEIIDLLEKLPMYVNNPTEEFAKAGFVIGSIDENTVPFKEVKNAAILSYSILLNKVYKHIGNNPKTVPRYLEERLQAFNHQLIHGPTYLSKLVHIMAIGNVGVGNVYKYLAPIVRGEDVFFVYVDIDKPEKYQIAAMWALAKSISHDKELYYNTYWPLLANSSNSQRLRLTAYELLVSKNPKIDMDILMNIHTLMEHEKDEHVFNYHYTTLQTMSELKDPCQQSVAEMMRKVLRLTKRHKNLSNTLSFSSVYDIFDQKYGFGSAIKVGIQYNEATGLPSSGYFSAISSIGRSTSDSVFSWTVDGINTKSFMQLIRQFSSEVKSPKDLLNPNLEQIKNVIRKTQGYKLLDDHVHIEFWSMESEYVTNVQVYFGTGLKEVLKEQADSYAGVGAMRDEEDAKQFMTDISYYNQYQLVVATDLGLPAIFYNEAPSLWYLRILPFSPTIDASAVVSLQIDAKIFEPSSYVMKFYNPFAATFHSVQRHVTLDVDFPINITIGITLNKPELKIILPRLPDNNSSIAGIKVYSIDQVEVFTNGTDVLKTHCPTCKEIAEVSKGPTHKHNYEKVVQLPETGLEYTYAIFDCESRVTKTSEQEEWTRIFNLDRNNVFGNNLIDTLFTLKQRSYTLLGMPYASTCGIMLKLSPSSVDPLSQIEMTWRADASRDRNKILAALEGNIALKGVNNETVRSWDVNLEGEKSELLYALNVHLTRKIPGQKDLKVCLAVQKDYPNLKLDSAKLETNTVIDFTVGKSDEDQCVRDDMVVKSVIKGELLDEQKEQLKKNVESGSCFKNPSNPLELDGNKRLDWNCFSQLIEATTLRKYSIDVHYKKIPHEIRAVIAEIGDNFRANNVVRATYKPDHTEEGNLKININYSPDNYYSTINVMNSDYSYVLSDVPYGINKEDIHQTALLDNVGFNFMFLDNYYKGNIRPCIAHANDIINDLNQTVPMNFKEWTLMYGDVNEGEISYAVFVKALDGDKVAAKIILTNSMLEGESAEEIEIHPGSSRPEVSVDGKPITLDDEDSISLLPIRITPMSGWLLVERHMKVQVYYTPFNVIAIPQIVLDRAIDGVCGHMGSTIYNQTVPLVYGSA